MCHLAVDHWRGETLLFFMWFSQNLQRFSVIFNDSRWFSKHPGELSQVGDLQEVKIRLVQFWRMFQYENSELSCFTMAVKGCLWFFHCKRQEAPWNEYQSENRSKTDSLHRVPTVHIVHSAHFEFNRNRPVCSQRRQYRHQRNVTKVTFYAYQRLNSVDTKYMSSDNMQAEMSGILLRHANFRSAILAMCIVVISMTLLLSLLT